MKRALTAIISLSLIFGLAGSSHAQVPVLKSALQEVQKSVGDLLETKDSDDLTPEEKEKQEMETRRATLAKVILLAVMEIDDIGAKLDALAHLDDGQKEIRDAHKKKMEEYREYYREVEIKFEKNPNPEEIKGLAADIKNWREETYNSGIRPVINFMFVYQGRQIFGVAEKRLGKIASDVSKLKGKSDKFGELEKLLNQAGTLLEESRAVLNRAEETLWQEINPPVSATSTAIIGGDSGAKPAEETETLLAPEMPDIKDLAKQSLEKIKSAYQIFLKMSRLAK